MDSISEQLIIGADFKIAVERRSMEMVEANLVAPKGALQCTSRDEVEADAEKYYKGINQRNIFICAVNEIEKYDWDVNANGAVYRINVPGHDITYYYPDVAKQETHIIKFYVVCYFTIGMSDLAAKTKLPNPIETASAAVTHDGSSAASKRPSPMHEERHFSHPFSHRLLPKESKPGRHYERTLGWAILAIFAAVLLIVPTQLVKVLRPVPAVVASAPEAPPAPQPSPPLPAPAPAPTAVPAPPALAAAAPAAKPGVAPQPPTSLLAPSKPSTPGGTENRTQQLQEALTKLGFYHGPITGALGPKTGQALTNFSHAVPPAIRQKFGQNTLAMAQAALKGEFTLLSRTDEHKGQ